MSSHLSKETIEGLRPDELARNLPPPRKEPDARRRIRERVLASGVLLAVFDDDPTGTQTVHDVPVCFDWSASALAPVVRAGDPLVFVSTNSRSLDGGAAARVSRAAARGVASAARASDRRVELISRSDSTLRGHYPREMSALARGLGAAVDLTLIVPAFVEGGRLTAGDVHWVVQDGRLVPAASTEFARDPVFGYRSSDLKLWVQEKTGGRVKAASVLSLSLDDIRTGGTARIAGLLKNAPRGATIIVNACADEDLEVVVLGMLDAEEAGRRFVCRTAASFVKVRAGVADRDLLSPGELGTVAGPVLILVGSYVQKTSRQLKVLLDGGDVDGIELHVEAMRSRAGREREVRDVAAAASLRIRQGRDVVVYTSREMHAGGDFLRFGAAVMEGLCAVARSVEQRPSAVIAKGGITSLALARAGFGARDARVTGQVIPGVPAWRLGVDSRFPGLPYVVFPGNVGDENALRDVLKRLHP